MKRRVCAVLVTATLAGCGTGGGGSGGPGAPVSPPVSDSSSPPSSDSSSPPASFEFPTLATVRANSDDVRALDVGTRNPHQIVRDQVRVSANGGGSFTVRVAATPNNDAYQFTVNLSPGAGAVNISNNEIEGFGHVLNYSALGVWTNRTHASWSNTVGVFGISTRAADLPRTGTATYSGEFIGKYTEGQTATFVVATATSTANFGSGAVSFETTNSNHDGRFNPTLDLAGSMAIQSGTSRVQGPVSTKIPGMTGEARGSFFGPSSASSAPPELGGTVGVKSNGDVSLPARSLIGGFVMKR
jgi:hypothetical protein